MAVTRGGKTPKKVYVKRRENSKADKKRENSKVGDKKRENSKKLPGQGEGKLRSVGKLQADKKRENS